jgi:sugar lactone lactonase YvrE
MEFATLIDRRFELAEGPVWDERRSLLFFIDAPERTVHAIGLDGTGLRTWTMAEPTASIGLCESGRLVVTGWQTLSLLDPDSGAVAPFARLDGQPGHARLNDGKVGPDGAFWVGTMDSTTPPRDKVGRLYRIAADGRFEEKNAGFLVSNGLAWTVDGRTMFHSDSRGPWVDRWNFDPATGAISARTRILTLTEAEGRPDGAACNVDGDYWSAGVSAGCVNRFDRDGKLRAKIPVPVPSPTMPCFCGANLRSLVVVSHTMRIPDHPMSGRIVIARAPVAGAAVGRVRGL